MNTTMDNKAGVAKLLNELVRLDYDAIEAYEAAIARLDDDQFKRQLTAFCEDHQRHTGNLGAHLRELGEEPPSGPDLKRILTEGKVIIAALAGDKAILMAMRANEEVTNKAYDKALEHTDAVGDIRSTLASNFEDERRHRAWLEATLDRL